MLNKTEERSGSCQHVIATWFTQIPNLARSSLKYEQTLLQSHSLDVDKILYVTYSCFLFIKDEQQVHNQPQV